MRVFWMCVLATAMLLGLYSCAEAQYRSPLQPPWYYDYPYRGKLTVIYLSPDSVHEVCKRGLQLDPSARVRACAYTYDKRPDLCEVVMPHKTAYSRDIWDQIFRHEIAHCNGWSGDHSGMKDIDDAEQRMCIAFGSACSQPRWPRVLNLPAGR